LFPRLKSIKNGASFADVAAIQERVTAVLRSIPKQESAFGSDSGRTGFSSSCISDYTASSLGNIASYPAIQTPKDFG
jgi:hypothetical protein